MADSKRRGADDEFDGDDDRTAPGRDVKATSGAAGSKDVSRPKSDGETRFVGRLSRFVLQVVAELQKVIWPTRKELLTYTTVVVVFVAVMMTFVALLDYGFAKAMIFVFGGNADS